MEGIKVSEGLHRSHLGIAHFASKAGAIEFYTSTCNMSTGLQNKGGIPPKISQKNAEVLITLPPLSSAGLPRSSKHQQFMAIVLIEVGFVCQWEQQALWADVTRKSPDDVIAAPLWLPGWSITSVGGGPPSVIRFVCIKAQGVGGYKYNKTNDN
ncbi:hypothetical protein CEXT_608381 [Caerostris extrusa]|uniref:Uncharacterized protein n=1 Tax=Caerostris extrusa TaxID=172846 RepID=A0AAV4TCG7_CAEEX|nr:hypothetical protein CEXT_608381 [Caerostris extrusa]